VHEALGYTVTFMFTYMYYAKINKHENEAIGENAINSIQIMR
jgi:hypothetical protein